MITFTYRKVDSIGFYTFSFLDIKYKLIDPTSDKDMIDYLYTAMNTIKGTENTEEVIRCINALHYKLITYYKSIDILTVSNVNLLDIPWNAQTYPKEFYEITSFIINLWNEYVKSTAEKEEKPAQYKRRITR